MSHTVVVDHNVEDSLVLYKLHCTCGWSRIALTREESELASAWHLNDIKDPAKFFGALFERFELGYGVEIAKRDRLTFLSFLEAHGYPRVSERRVSDSVLRIKRIDYK